MLRCSITDKRTYGKIPLVLLSFHTGTYTESSRAGSGTGYIESRTAKSVIIQSYYFNNTVLKTGKAYTLNSIVGRGS